MSRPHDRGLGCIRRCAGVLVVGVLLAALSAAAVAAERTVRVGVFDNPPIVLRQNDGTYAGFAVSLLSRVAKVEGWTLVFDDSPWATLLKKLSDGDIDILVGIGYDAERAQTYDFTTQSIIGNWGVVYVRPGSGIAKIEHLAGKRIAMASGSIHTHAIERLLARRNIPFEPVATKNNVETFSRLAEGDADAGVVNRLFGGEWGRPFNLRATEIVFNPVNVHYAVPRGKNEDLIQAVDRHLNAWKENPESIYFALLREWIAKDRNGEIPAWIVWMVSIVGGGFAIAVVGVVVLRRQVRARTEKLVVQAEELNASNERFEDFAEASSDWFWEMNADLLFTYFSAHFSEMTGIDAADLIGKGRGGLVVETIGDTSLDAHLDILRRRLPFRDFRFKVLNKKGQAVFVSISGKPIVSKQGDFTGYRGTGRDITAEHNLKVSLDAAEAMILQAQKMEAIGQLTGGIAHDFNNLLNIIGGNLELLEDRIGDDATAKRFIGNASRAVGRSAELIRQMLAFSRKQALNPQAVDVNKLIATFGHMLARSLGEDIQLDIVPAENLRRGFFDPGQLEHAILNLAVNARDAMPDGGRVTIETQNADIDEEYSAINPEAVPGRYVRIRVADDGPGIPPDVLGHIFEPFFTTKEVGKGTGLGLAMVYGFIKQSGGHINVYSEVGHGTTFNIYLPEAPADAGSGTDVPESAADSLPRGTETVLVVEDNPDVCAYVVTIVESLGYAVRFAESGPAALQLADGIESLDLLLTDMVLAGGMNGREVAEKVVRRHPNAAVLFMSGYSKKPVGGDEGPDGVGRLIEKPFSRAKLARAIRAALDRRAVSA